ncbi:M48 family metallopeptidase [Alphaproteobacteria bacterium]|nr:M48 family metallopeptidase [Alphaproteobacteria bacterium]
MNPTFDKDLSIEVVRTKRRKTASIKVIDGVVQAIVPEQLSDARVEGIIQKRTPWIRKKLREQSQAVTPKPKEYVSGENFTYLGRNYRLKVLLGENQQVKLKGGYLEVGLSKKPRDEDIRKALVEWFEKQALKRLTEKTKRYSAIMGVSPNSISVRDYKSRWGSCSSSGEISYNWRIIIAPHHIVDYVVVHELCHLKHPNHSPTYWKSVKREIADYDVRRKWLKVHGTELVI